MTFCSSFSRTRMAWLVIAAAAVLAFCPLALASGGEAGAHAAEAVEHGGEHGGGDHGHADFKTWKDIDTWKVVNFAVLAIALFILVRKPAASALAGRIDDIKKELDDLETRRKQAAEELEAVNKRLANLEAEAAKVVDSYVAQGEAARDKILEEAKKSADRLSEQAQRHMAHEIEDAKKRLRADILERAIEMGEQLIAKNITEQDQDRLVGEYLDKVVTQ